MVLHPAVARDGVAVISVLFLTLFGKDGGEGSIVECGDRMRESEGGVLVLIYALTNRANTIVLALLVRAYINKSVVILVRIYFQLSRSQTRRSVAALLKYRYLPIYFLMGTYGPHSPLLTPDRVILRSRSH